MSAEHSQGKDVHEHEAGHDHSAAGHSHAPKDFGRAFALGITLQVTFIVAEVIVGLAANSLAVLSDAGHNVSDALALALAWGATYLSKRKATRGRTYGLKSTTILATVVNALTLVFVNGMVAWEAIGRFRHPEPIAAKAVVIVSIVGVVVNGFCAWLFAKGSEGDINVRAAYLHLASDAAVAAGVAITGVAIYYTKWMWLDPAASLVVSVIVLVSTWSLLRVAVDLAMHAVPRGLDEEKVRQWLLSQENVLAIHDLHIWALSTTEHALSVHLVMKTMPSDALAADLDARIRGAFAVHHVTVQIDPDGAACSLLDAHA